jgi:predicted amidohydrolase
MKVGFIQYAPVTGDKEKNLEKIKTLIKGEKADIFVLPEMGMTGYPTGTREELVSNAETMDGPLVKSLIQIAKENDTCLVVGMPEIVDDKIFNTTVAVNKDGLLAKYQKAHLFMEEKNCLDSGTTQPVIFKLQGFKIALGICYDYMFPEFWRKLALAQADLFCNTANFVFDYGFRVMQVRSIENGVFSITVNRVGEEDGILYRGGSEIVDNRGNILVKANETEEKAYTKEVDLNLSKDKQWNRLNNLFADRREDIY